MTETYIYKICTAQEWQHAVTEGVYRGSAADLRDGFIHFSAADQVASTAAKHFAGQGDLVLVTVDTGALDHALRWEPSRGGALFPHLYAPLPVSAAIRAEPLPLGQDGRHQFPAGPSLMPKLYDFARLGLFALEPEQAHEVTLRALESGVYRRAEPDDPRLAQTICGLRFPNPIGMAAGFDKDARVPDALTGMGFGFSEAGTVTPKPQPGNPRPRVFRLPAHGAIINRLGFNGSGHETMLRRLQRKRPRGILGINIGANKTSAEPVGDYVTGVKAFAPFASYIAVNISSPNTPGLRDLQAPERLDALLSRVMAARAEGNKKPPLFVKLAPDIADDDLPAIVERILAHGADGMILTNTTLSRNGVPMDAHRGEAGGLSGRPLFTRATRTLARVYRLTGGAVPLIGTGGVDSGEAALAKIRAGASLVQLYTGLIYEGPGLMSGIKKTLITAMERESVTDLAALRGRDADRWADMRV